MKNRITELGGAELRAARGESRGFYWIVALFSLFANLLMLTGPMYMLQVYDRVLGSKSQETLVALSLLVVFLYGIMGILDFTRGRIMARVGARFQSALDRRVFDAVIRKSAVAPDLKTQSGLNDLEAIQRFITSPVLLAFFDSYFSCGHLYFPPYVGLDGN
jgi:ABC-type protease/lipase transport system fused ATPase/permease subunit